MIKINNIDKKCKIIRGGVENERWRGKGGGGANVNFRRVLKNERCVRSYEYHISSLRILDFLYFYPYVNTFI